MQAKNQWGLKGLSPATDGGREKESSSLVGSDLTSGHPGWGSRDILKLCKRPQIWPISRKDCVFYFFSINHVSKNTMKKAHSKLSL